MRDSRISNFYASSCGKLETTTLTLAGRQKLFVASGMTEWLPVRKSRNRANSSQICRTGIRGANREQVLHLQEISAFLLRNGLLKLDNFC